MSSIPANSTPTMRALASGIKANVPTLIWGDPGQGKSAKISSAAESSGYYVEVVVGSVRESSDYLGLPIEKDGRVVYSPPNWAVNCNTAPKSLLFLDELTTASPSVQKANLRLMQERYAGDYKLGDHVAIIAAANPPETAADGWELPAPVANRLFHLDWHFDAAEWLANVATDFKHTNVLSIDALAGEGTDADRARAAAMVVGFLNTRPDLNAPNPPADPAEAGKAWPSPRSWTNVMKVLTFVRPNDEEVLMLVVKGLVGEGAAKELLAWLAVVDLYDPSEVLANPSVVDWSNRPDRLFALLLGIEALVVARGDEKSWTQGMEVLTQAAESHKPDLALPAARTLLLNRPSNKVGIDPRAQQAFADLMQRTEFGFKAA